MAISPSKLSLAAAAVLIAGLSLSGCTALFPSSAPPATDSSTGEEIEQTDTDVFALSVGECLNDTDGTEVSEVPLVDCADEHDFEVYSDFELTGDEFPGTDAINTEADAKCLTEFESFVGISYDDSTLGYTYFTPTEGSWTDGDDRLVSCLIGDPNGKVTGTLKGAAK
ncbi:septum formation family protein [Herbiconiux sp. VKM Ac-1786]|uniref:septum formation family protein n=1 Tax=Herbiconiux sp. VKM Ac-1786 TaxID=2783824 RepID=UPI00188CC161|nr:septum formation family protein [Herbiconiux sp. VKM Ac-1786]MBF4573847.1 septum formation family protein [Herbiconiux sp. VKM Ac-1786]